MRKTCANRYSVVIEFIEWVTVDVIKKRIIIAIVKKKVDLFDLFLNTKILNKSALHSNPNP